MNNAQLEEFLTEVQDVLGHDIQVSVTIPRKSAVMLFGAIICANVATVFTLLSLAEVTKKYTKPKLAAVTDISDDGSSMTD